MPSERFQLAELGLLICFFSVLRNDFSPHSISNSPSQNEHHFVQSPINKSSCMTNFACQFYESRDKPFSMGSSQGCLGNDEEQLGVAKCCWVADVCLLMISRVQMYSRIVLNKCNAGSVVITLPGVKINTSSRNDDDDDYD
jgi:hypothetical protein